MDAVVRSHYSSTTTYLKGICIGLILEYPSVALHENVIAAVYISLV